MSDSSEIARRCMPGLTRRRLLSGVGFSAFIMSIPGCERGSDGRWPKPNGQTLISNPTLLPSPAGDEVVFSAEDSENPLHIFRIPITRRMQHLADQLAQGTDSATHFVDRCMAYIDGFSVGIASLSTPDATALERVGACGTFTNTLLALSRCRGIRGRYVGLYNFPPGDGHTLCELHIDNRWMLFDPTTHVYFIDGDREKARPLSYHEVHRYFLFNSPIKRIGGNHRSGIDLYSSGEIYQTADPQGIIGPGLPMIFPLSLDTRAMPVLRKEGFGPKFQGSNFIGAASTNQQQLWTLSGLDIGGSYEFSIRPNWIGGDLAPDDREFRLDYSLEGGLAINTPASLLDFSKLPLENWTLRFSASQTEVRLLLTHPYRGPEFRYFHALEYRLRPLDHLPS
ncbi:MAG: transglutaminase domain-containing protein [Pseudomonadales bacterium]